MQTWLSHFDLLRIVTAPAKRTLSIYAGVIGKSVSSIDIFCLLLLSKDLGDRNWEGLEIENGVPVLSLNRIIYFENWAIVEDEKPNNIINRKNKIFSFKCNYTIAKKILLIY